MTMVVVCGILAGLAAEILLLMALTIAVVERVERRRTHDGANGDRT